MSTTLPNGQAPGATDTRSTDTADSPRMRPPRRRRSVPWLITGVLLVAGFGLAFTVTSLRLGGKEPVLAVTHAVPAGATLEPADVRVVRVAAGPELDLVSADAKQRVLGSTTAVPLTAGAPLTTKTLGPVSYPPPGQAVVGVSVQPGRYPPGLSAGATVAVVTTRESGSATGDQSGSVAAVEATVTAVRHPATGVRGETVVALRLPEADAADVSAAAAAGRVSLVRLSPGGEDQ